jgi:hypothetical protein
MNFNSMSSNFSGTYFNLSTSGIYPKRNTGSVIDWFVRLNFDSNVFGTHKYVVHLQPPHAWQSDQMIFLSSVIAFTTIFIRDLSFFDTLNLDIFFWWFRDWEWCVMIDIISKYIKDRPIFQFWQWWNTNSSLNLFFGGYLCISEWFLGQYPIFRWLTLINWSLVLESFENTKCYHHKRKKTSW